MLGNGCKKEGRWVTTVTYKDIGCLANLIRVWCLVVYKLRPAVSLADMSVYNFP